MTDRYTELVKQAYEAQQAREGEAYQALTAKLTDIDGQLRNLAYQRETTVVDLEAMDDAVEAAKEALDAYFAGRDEDADEPTESDDGLFEAITPLPTEEDAPWDETTSARGGGGLNDIPN